MNCHECGKEMKGGFGSGERPFKIFHCADCVIRLNHQAHYKWGLEYVKKVLEAPIYAEGKRAYKAQANQLNDQRIKALSMIRLILEDA